MYIDAYKNLNVEIWILSLNYTNNNLRFNTTNSQLQIQI